MFLWKCNSFPLLLIDRSRNVEMSFRNATRTHKLAMNLTPDPYRKWTWVPWVRSVFRCGLVSGYKYYNLNSPGCQWLNNTNAADAVRMSNGGGGLCLRFISQSSSQMGSLHFLQSENPKPSCRVSPSVTWPSPPFHASVRSFVLSAWFLRTCQKSFWFL